MEQVASKDAPYSRYGSDSAKQAYIYCALDLSPTILTRSFGFGWSVGGWLLFPFLQKAGEETIERMKPLRSSSGTLVALIVLALTGCDNVDWGGVDVLRDRADGRLYIVDANKTDMGPPIALNLPDKLKATRMLAQAFREFVRGG